MHRNYKIEERVLRNIIKSNAKCTEENTKLNIIFYYRNHKTCNLVMKNNMVTERSPLSQTNVIYSFTCPNLHCKAENYIGMTQTTLSRRLTNHAQSGSIYNHFKYKHNCKPSRDNLTGNTKIIAKAENRQRLAIKEALLILKYSPSINNQFDNFTNILKLHSHRAIYETPKVHQNKSIDNINDENIVSASHSDLLNTKPPSPNPVVSTVSLSPSPYSPQSFSPSLINSEYSMLSMSKSPNLIGSYTEDDTNLIPDFSKILLKFGIDYDNLNQVPLKYYYWMKFPIDESTDSPTISQRIKSMSRGVKKSVDFSQT